MVNLSNCGESAESTEKQMATLLVVSVSTRPRLASLLREAGEACSRLYVRVDNSLPLQTTLPLVYAEASRTVPWLDVRVLLSGRDRVWERVVGEGAKPASYSPKYRRVCLGGTFDRLHNGHKVLLSHAALLCSDTIICGVTDKEMIHKKTLWELIEPISTRIRAVEEFLSDVSEVRCEAVPILDPFGPAIVDRDLEAIIVSEETRIGGQKVNEKRRERQMDDLDMEVVQLIDGADDILKECKLSSSTRRRQLLGTLLKKPNEFSDRKDLPYTIGLTGGIASGKTHIGNDLRSYGYEVLECDRIAHECYAPHSELSKKIDVAFPGVVHNGIVDRKALGNIVFNDKACLHELNSLVWPAVFQEVMVRLRAIGPSKVVFLEAAAIVEAEWDTKLNELWTVFVDPEEEIKRTKERDGLDDDQAAARVSSQISNIERIAHSNVVFCSKWDRAVTQQQVKVAIELLRQRTP